MPGPKNAPAHLATVDFELSPYELELTAWNPNRDYVPEEGSNGTSNLYTLLFPFQNIGDQLDSEIMPLRVQWAAEEQKSELDPNSESWQRFKRLYGYQFGEQKTVGLYAPELSFPGEGHKTVEQYSFGRYLRIVYLYVKPSAQAEFEEFVHRFIVPAAEKILAQRDVVTNAPPPEARTYWRLPKYVRKVAINVNMPTIPEFELFIQERLLTAARDTNTPVLTYRTVTGDRHNYHLLFPFEEDRQMHHDGSALMASLLMREHQLQLLAKRLGSLKAEAVAFGEHAAAREEALGVAQDLSAQFHSHAIEIEEIVYHTRPDMSATLEGRYSKESVKAVWDHYRGMPKRA